MVEKTLTLLNRLLQSDFVKNVSIVMSGTVIAQLMGFALIPIISRLFTPNDFGVFGSFIALLAIAEAAVTLQYSQAVMLPKTDEDAINVFAVSCLSVFLMTAVIAIAVLLFPGKFLAFMKAEGHFWLVWLFPVAVLLRGLNQALQAWCIRRKAFKKTAASQLIGAFFSNGLQIASGLFRTGGAGLIASNVAASGIANVNLAHQIFSKDVQLLKRSLDWKSILKQMNEFRDFPIYSATQNVMNALSQGLPILVLSSYYGIAVAGAYAFCLKILQAPMSLVLTSLRQVLFQKASETHNKGGDLYDLFIKTTLGLFALAIIPTIILMFLAPSVFVWIFGQPWQDAGRYAQWLILWHLFLFCNVPSVLIARILRMQRKLFIYEIFILVTRTLTLVVGGQYLIADNTIVLFSSLGVVQNVLLILWIWHTLWVQNIKTR